jgi:hypothetical protein
LAEEAPFLKAREVKEPEIQRLLDLIDEIAGDKHY